MLIQIGQVLSCDCMEGENTAQICAHFKKIKKILAFALPATIVCNVAEAVERLISSPILK